MKIEKESREIAWAQELIRMTWAYRAARVLQAAVGLGLVEKLREGGTAADVAAAEGWNSGLLEKLLIACAAMGLVERVGEEWRPAEKGRATLLADAPLYQGDAIAHSASVWDFWHGLERRVRGDDGAFRFDEPGEGSRSHREFILAMHDMGMAGRAALLAECVDLSGKKSLVDVGGGPGTYSMALCQRYPGLQATILDLPETVAIAREVIERMGMGDRVRAVEGNWDEVEFGEGVDAVLMSNVLHGPNSGAEMKLAKAHRALLKGGALIVQDFMLDAEKSGPLNAALFNIMVGSYSTGELAAIVEEAGFADLRFHAMPGDLGTSLLVATR